MVARTWSTESTGNREPAGISAKTVSNHLEHIYTKLAVTNRAGAAMRAMEYGIVGPTATQNA